MHDGRAQFPARPSIRELLLVAAVNGGLVLLALHVSALGPPWLGPVGAAFSLLGGGMALLKAWAFPLLSRARPAADRARRTWGLPPAA